MRALATLVDLIGWHPFYQTDPRSLRNYTADVRALEDLLPADVNFTATNLPEGAEAFAMKRGGEVVLAVWAGGALTDDSEVTSCDFTIQGRFTSARGYDPLAGTYHELSLHHDGEATVLREILVKDHPVLVMLGRAV